MGREGKRKGKKGQKGQKGKKENWCGWKTNEEKVGTDVQRLWQSTPMATALILAAAMATVVTTPSTRT